MKKSSITKAGPNPPDQPELEAALRRLSNKLKARLDIDAIASEIKDVLSKTWDSKVRAALVGVLDQMDDLSGPISVKEYDEYALLASAALGRAFAEAAGVPVVEWQRAAFTLGFSDAIDGTGVDFAWNLEDTRSLRVLGDDTRFWIGSYYDDNLQEAFKAQMQDFFQGGYNRQELATLMRVHFRDLAKKPDSYWDLLADHIATKTREIGRVSGYEAAGIEVVRVRARLDERTTQICRRLHGHIISVSVMREQIRTYLEACETRDKDKIKKAWPWWQDKAAKGLDTAEKINKEIKKGNIGLPPYHGRCRTKTVAEWDHKPGSHLNDDLVDGWAPDIPEFVPAKRKPKPKPVPKPPSTKPQPPPLVPSPLTPLQEIDRIKAEIKKLKAVDVDPLEAKKKTLEAELQKIKVLTLQAESILYQLQTYGQYYDNNTGKTIIASRVRISAAKTETTKLQLSESIKKSDLLNLYTQIGKAEDDLKGNVYALMKNPSTFTITPSYDSNCNIKYQASAEAAMAWMEDMFSFDPFKGQGQRFGLELNRARCDLTGKAWLETSDTADIFVHEMGHHIEFANPDILQKSVDFRDARTVGETATPIHGRANELGKKDKFFSHYCGREYQSGGSDYATEILSMGLERMRRDPVGFLLDDEDYFTYVFKIMRGL